MKEISLSQALKVKNRLSGELRRLEDIARRENSKEVDFFNRDVCQETFRGIETVRCRLVEVKAKIFAANANIGNYIADLAESKSEIEFYKSLSCKSGDYKETVGYSDKCVVDRSYIAFKCQEEIDAQIKSLQDHIDGSQDAIDAYNATTKVELSFL